MTTADNRAAVRRDGSKVWLDGVKGFDAGQYASSVHGSQARILDVLGESLSYDDLICYSGFAFRVGLHEQMCPSAGHPCCGFMCVDGSNRALPWNVEFYESLPGSGPKKGQGVLESKACLAIKQSIDRGIPVHYSNEEDGLIIGYEARADGGYVFMPIISKAWRRSGTTRPRAWPAVASGRGSSLSGRDLSPPTSGCPIVN